MKAEVKRVRIWDGAASEYDPKKHEFGPCVYPFAAKVVFGAQELTIINPKTREEGEVVVLASDAFAEGLWREFVAAKAFKGTGFPRDVANQFADFLEEERGAKAAMPSPYS
jgi:hypothetical protein